MNALSEIDKKSALAFLASHAAGRIPHLGTTLLRHLKGTYELLRRWESPTATCLAGLCHAVYGTDGLPDSLEDFARRDTLASAVGREAEQLVYFYASCDRAWLYPQIVPQTLVGIHDVARAEQRLRDGLFPVDAGKEITFRDRFTGAAFTPPPALYAAFWELTFANELEIISRRWPHVPEQNRIGWQAIFEACRPHVSEAAYSGFRTIFQLDDERRAA